MRASFLAVPFTFAMAFSFTAAFNLPIRVLLEWRMPCSTAIVVAYVFAIRFNMKNDRRLGINWAGMTLPTSVDSCSAKLLNKR